MDRKRYGKTSAEHMQLRPEEFSWDKQKELDQKTEAWMNRQPFEYDMSRDPFYQQYKQQYAALGNLAMQDTVGQVSALTGGYANSYAQTAGQQAYQQYMDQLSSMMPELYSMSRGNYDAEGQQLYNEIALLEGQRSQAYNEYQADVNDWYNYLSVLQNQEAAARSSGGVGTPRTSTIPEYIIDRLDKGFYSDEERMAYLVGQTQTGAINSTQMGQLAAAYQGYNLEPEDTDSETEEEPFVRATFMREEEGNYVFDKGGKEYTYAKGINPYTGTKNPDIKDGAFTNGYQPNNVKGQKLEKTGDFVYVNGIKQNVWKTPDGTRWVWDGTENRYIKESEAEFEY